MEIINYLPQHRFPRDRRTQLRDLTYVSKRFRDLATPMLYEHVCLWVPNADRLIATLVDREEIKGGIRSLDLELSPRLSGEEPSIRRKSRHEIPKVLNPLRLNKLPLDTCAEIAQASCLSRMAQRELNRDLARGELVA